MSEARPESPRDLQDEKMPVTEAEGLSSDHCENAPRNNEKLQPASTVFQKSSEYIEEEHQTETMWTWKTIIVTASLAGLFSGSLLPFYFCSASLSFISRDIGGASLSAWLVSSYGLAAAAFAPFSGYMQDLVGRRNITLGAGAILMIGCIVLATAQNFGSAIVGMSLAGAGGTICELSALAGTSELVPVNRRGVYLALVVGSVVPFTPYIIYAELLSTHSTWRWGIWLCLIWIGIFMSGLLFFYFPESQTAARVKGLAARAILKRIDYLGGALSIIGVTLVLVALNSGGYTHPWSSAYVLVELIIGFALLAALFIWEWKFCKNPMVPHELFKGQRVVAMALVVVFVAGMNLFATSNFMPLELAAVFSPDPIKVGLRGLGFGFGVTAGGMLGNAAIPLYKGRCREVLVIACSIMTAFAGAFAVVNPNREGLAVALGALVGLGNGAVLNAASLSAVTVSPDTSIATAVALIVAVRAVGGAIGNAIYQNVFNNKIKANLPTYIAQYAMEAGLPPQDAQVFVKTFLSAPSLLSAQPGVTESIIEAATLGGRWAYAESLRYVWYTSIPFGVCATIACFFIGNISKYMTSRVAARIRE